jgi:hypothetical protein
MEKPKQKTVINLKELEKSCQEYLDFIDNDEDYNEDELDDYKQFVFERAMEAVFGNEVWEFVNNRQD